MKDVSFMEIIETLWGGKGGREGREGGREEREGGREGGREGREGGREGREGGREGGKERERVNKRLSVRMLA